MRAAIFDLDGTMFDPSARLFHLDGEVKDWKAFHDAMDQDPVVEPIARLARAIHRSAAPGADIEAVLIVTARHDDPRYRQMTEEALFINEIPHHRLYMRAMDDTRPDHIVKAEILQRILDDGYEPVLAIDDRESVIAMWRDHGICTLQCASGAPSSAYAGQTLLHMLVGPCGAGKSTWARSTCKPHDIVSTDELRMQLYGDLGHSPEALARVWKYAHGLIRARLESGVFTVLDATNLQQEDRKAVLDLVPRGVFVRYVVIDRDLRLKEQQRDWRSEELIMKQHRMFRKEEGNILAGNGHPYVTVQDIRKRLAAA